MKQLFLFGFLLLLPFSQVHADYKIGVIDLGKAFDSYYKTKDAQTRIKAKEDGFTKEIQDMNTDYEHMGEEFTKLKESAQDPALAPEARADKQKALEAKLQDLRNQEQKMQTAREERSRELQDEIVRRHKEIVDEITQVITAYSGPQGFDIVIDKSSATSSGVSFVLFTSNKLIDITQDIITKLNSAAPAGGAAAPAAGGNPGAAPSPAAAIPH